MELHRTRNTAALKDDPPPIVRHIFWHKTSIITLGFLILCILPVFSAWYYGDDAVNRDIRAFMLAENKNLFQHISDRLQYSLITLGRFNPVSAVQVSLTFYVFNDIEVYRFYNGVMNFLAVYCFASMVKAYSGSRKLFYAVMILFPGMFMFLTRYDDAITSYYMLIQTLVIYLSLSLILLKKYLENKKTIYLILSVFIYIMSLLTYELSYPLFLAYPLAIFYFQQGPTRERIKKAVIGSLSYLAAMLACFSIYIWFSANAVSAYDGVNLNIDMQKTAVTFLKQTVAAFPVVPHAYLILDLEWNFIFDMKQTIANVSLMDILSSIIFTYLLIKLSGLKDDIPPARKRFLIRLAVLLTVCPSLLISVSKKYQDTLIWGLGYLTIYLTRFGILILGYFLYDSIIKQIKKISLKRLVQTLSLLILVVIHLFCQQGNRDVLYHKNKPHAIRHVAEMSIESGILKDMPDGSILLLGDMWYEDYNPENRTSLFNKLCGIKLSTDTIDQFIKKNWENIGKPVTYNYNDIDVYYFEFNKFQSDAGYAFSSKLETMSIDETKVNVLHGRDVKIFYSGEDCDSFQISVKIGDAFALREFQLIPNGSSGSGTRTAEIDALVDLQSIEFR